MNEELFDIVYFEEHFKEGQCRFEHEGTTVTMLESDDAYIVQTDPPFPEMVCDFKMYYADTLTLLLTGQLLKNGSTKIGVWKTYDREGILVEEKDYEDGWKIHWEQLAEILRKQEIELASVVSITRFDGGKAKPVGVRRTKRRVTIVPSNGADKEEVKSQSESAMQEKYYWKVIQLASSLLVVNYTFDGQTGKRIDVSFTEMK